MLEYIKAMTPWERAGLAAGSALGVLFFFVFFWSMALACVALGYGPEVCGL